VNREERGGMARRKNLVDCEDHQLAITRPSGKSIGETHYISEIVEQLELDSFAKFPSFEHSNCPSIPPRL
jgi:hypothetical protein